MFGVLQRIFCTAHTCEESSHAKGGCETGLLGNILVFETVLDVQRVREDHNLLVCDALAVIKFAHHFDEVGGVTGVLTDARVNISKGLALTSLSEG